MKKTILFLFFSSLFLISCNSVKHSDVSGSSSFYIENLSGETILVSAVLLNGENVNETMILPNEVKKILYWVEIGTNPTPELVFETLTIENADSLLLYKQDPVRNSLWLKKCSNSQNAEYYHSDYYYNYK